MAAISSSQGLIVCLAVLVLLASMPDVAYGNFPPQIYGLNELDTEGGNALIYFLEPKATEEQLNDIVVRVRQLAAIIKDFKIPYVWKRINGFVVSGASKTLALLLAETQGVEFGALIDLTCSEKGLTG